MLQNFKDQVDHKKNEIVSQLEAFSKFFLDFEAEERSTNKIGDLPVFSKSSNYYIKLIAGEILSTAILRTTDILSSLAEEIQLTEEKLNQKAIKKELNI